MDKPLLQPLSGFRDQLESSQLELVGRLKRIFERFGYRDLETPIIERQEILLGKLGDDAQKLLYLFEDNGSRKVGLRYDLTVPLSRFVAANYGQLPLPFKRYEIGPVFRAERPQAGRFRQFTQADVDIVGSAAGEGELLEIIAAVVEQYGLKLTILINDRRIVTAIFDQLKIPAELRLPLLRLLDKKDKIGANQVVVELGELGLTETEKKAIAGIFLNPDEALDTITELLGDFEPLSELISLINIGDGLGLKMKFDPAMVRGLDYYTGVIFECVADEYDGGTVVAGGRYDNLVANLLGTKVPAVGISFGLDRLGEVLKLGTTLGLFIVCLPETEAEVRAWAASMRRIDVIVEVYPDSAVELGKQIKYADKWGYQSVIIPLLDAWQNGQVAVKNLATGDQKLIDRTKISDVAA